MDHPLRRRLRAAAAARRAADGRTARGGRRRGYRGASRISDHHSGIDRCGRHGTQRGAACRARPHRHDRGHHRPRRPARRGPARQPQRRRCARPAPGDSAIARRGRNTVKVLVCGTGFGRVYLRALEREPFQLTGILARGGERSRACAREYGVPLHTAPDQVPDGVDLACVVVPSGVGGGPGAELAQAFLARDIPVVLEHPVRADELADCLRVAARRRVMFGVNTFYVHLEPVRRFLDAAHRLLRTHPATFVDASCAVQVSYDLLDIIGQTLGGLSPWALEPSEISQRLHGLARSAFTDRCVNAVIAGVPVTLRVNNQVVPDDLDHPTHLRHQVTLGTEAGTLVLASTHGPVLWCPAVHVPKDDGTFALDGVDASPTVACLGPSTAPGVRDVFDQVWPDGVRHSLLTMRQAVADGVDPLAAGQYHLTLSRLWSELTRGLGYPLPVRREPAPAVWIDELLPGRS
ncbi:Gfo/Idh/MocA family oxidoreductase [Nocardia otitidiscaviarum]|nr:Gfo/Idh/MocA family oxidoreductase [Nocardia otitidiscaviarum]MBF6488388.1 Gfo/Idh/MocA family oxidoreductase [Nocardia otitidiscaviarum]